MPWKLNQDSFSKCVVYFSDGNTRTFYSIDWTHKFTKNRNRELGLSRLEKMLAGWGNKVRKAIIYDTATDREIMRYSDGVRENPANQ